MTVCLCMCLCVCVCAHTYVCLYSLYICGTFCIRTFKESDVSLSRHATSTLCASLTHSLPHSPSLSHSLSLSFSLVMQEKRASSESKQLAVILSRVSQPQVKLQLSLPSICLLLTLSALLPLAFLLHTWRWALHSPHNGLVLIIVILAIALYDQWYPKKNE